MRVTIEESNGIFASLEQHIHDPGLIIIPGKGITEVNPVGTIVIDPNISRQIYYLAVVGMPATKFRIGKMYDHTIWPTLRDQDVLEFQEIRSTVTDASHVFSS